jgi:hypothetical protein
VAHESIEIGVGTIEIDKEDRGNGVSACGDDERGEEYDRCGHQY